MRKNRPLPSLEALRALDAIDRNGSFAAAAEALFKVPSALTYTISKLEEDLGVVLFDRSKHRAELTPVGHLVLEQGRELLRSSERLTDRVLQFESGWEPEIRIVRDTLFPEVCLLEAIAEFQKLDKPVDVCLDVEVLSGGWEALQQGRADLVIGLTGELPKGLFEVKPVGSVSFLFCVAADHPLASLDRIELSDLAEQTAIQVRDSAVTLPIQTTGVFESKRIISVNSMDAKLLAQKQGLGVGFLPRSMAMPAVKNGSLVAKETEAFKPDQTLFLAWRKGSEGQALKWFSERLALLNLQL